MKKPYFFSVLSLCAALCSALCACHSQQPAPVGKTKPSTLSTQGKYRAVWGDTIYSIAWLYDMDPEELMKLNHLSANVALKEGQLITVGAQLAAPAVNVAHSVVGGQPAAPLTESPVVDVAQSVGSRHASTAIDVTQKSAPAVSVPSKILIKADKLEPTPIGKGRLVAGLMWFKPFHGKILEAYNPNLGNRGIDFTGEVGTPVRAACKGKVVYYGNGIRGLGNLIILKHNDHFLSAYAHNERLLVKEGDMVQAGQPIATLGRSDSDTPKLHFEIRKNGKPVNPADYLG